MWRMRSTSTVHALALAQGSAGRTLKVKPPKPPAPPKKKPPKPKVAKKVRDEAGMNEAELAKFAELKRKHQDLQEAHDLLKKYIRFSSERKAKSSRSSIGSGTGSPSATSAKTRSDPRRLLRLARAATEPSPPRR